MKKSVIYSLINLKTNQWYIGSSIDFDNRIRQHLYLLKVKEHPNPKLQHSWDKYGENSFIFHVIEYCSSDRLLELEQLYIDGLNPYYNIAVSSSSPMKGRKHSDKTRAKLSGRIPWNRGKPRTKEEKALMSYRKKEENKLKPKEFWERRSEITKKAIAKNGGSWFKGKHHTEDNKKHFRQAHIKDRPKILCINTQEIFDCQNDIAKKYNIKQGHISENLSGKRASVKGLKFKYV